MRGPLVYAADRAYLLDGTLLDDITLRLDPQGATKHITLAEDEGTRHIHLLIPAVSIRGGIGAPVWREEVRYHDLTTCIDSRETSEVRYVPFFDAGNRDPDRYHDGIWPDGGGGTSRQKRVEFQVWTPYRCAEF